MRSLTGKVLLGRKSTSGISLTVVFTVLIILAITLNSFASPGTRSKSANCNSCHNSSFYLTVDILFVDAPSQVQRKDQVTVNVTVKVSGSHKSSTYTGFGIDVWLFSTKGKTSTGSHQILNGQSLSGTSAPFTWEKVFAFTVTGASGGTDTINANAKMSPRHYSPPVTDTEPFTMEVLNSPPSLRSGLVDPLEGSDTDTFSYKVNLTDQEGDIPSYVRVQVDNDRKYDLALLPGGDGSTKNGEDYGVSGVILPKGSHNFSFEASDGSASTTYPIGSQLPGPNVIHINSPPRLDSGTVSPLAGTPGDKFTYTVVYYDDDGEAPLGGVKLLLDGGLGTEEMVKDPGAPYPYRDGSFLNGEGYTTTISLALGEHSYSFNATDGIDHVELGPFTGPVVSIDPVMKAYITAPQEGQVFFDNESIEFIGHIDANINVTDANFTWASNRSGLLGSGEVLKIFLDEGYHSVTLTVGSEEHQLSAVSTVNVTVTKWEEPPVVPAILGYLPADNITMNEMEELEFSVSLNPHHPIISSGGYKEFRWFVDSNSTGQDSFRFVYSPDLNGSGEHMVCSVVIVGAETYHHCWNVTVKNLAVPILVNGTILDDLGDIYEGEVLSIVLPLEDPYGRALSVKWEVDGIVVMGDSLSLDLLLSDGPWAAEGAHVLVAKVTNPDAVLLRVEMSYNVVLKSIDDDDAEDDDDEDDDGPGHDDDDDGAAKQQLFKDPARAAIIIIGAVGILLGIIYAVYAVLAPVEKRRSEVIDE